MLYTKNFTRLPKEKRAQALAIATAVSGSIIRANGQQVWVILPTGREAVFPL